MTAFTLNGSYIDAIFGILISTVSNDILYMGIEGLLTELEESPGTSFFKGVKNYSLILL